MSESARGSEMLCECWGAERERVRECDREGGCCMKVCRRGVCRKGECLPVESVCYREAI